MKRRDFITLLGGAAAAWPLAARAQLPGMPVVGLLTNASFEGFADGLRAFRSGLGEAGFVEGRNLAIGSYQAEGDDNRLSALAAELVQRGVNVIVTNGTATAAAKAATASIPIVFFTGADPVALGLVASLNRPGGNLTGVAVFADFLGPKRLELLHEMVPAVTNIAVLVNPANPAADRQMKDLQTAAHTFGLLLHVLNASAEQDFDAAFATLVKQRASALLEHFPIRLTIS
jgi:putative tryptophan/tyrosine transport system substrate-binding protein